MKLPLLKRRRLRLCVERANGWNVHDTSGLVHWVSDTAVDDTVAYLRDRGQFVRKERAWK